MKVNNMSGRWVYFWKSLYPLLKRFCREHSVPLNKAVNLAVSDWLGDVSVGKLRLQAELDRLLREEAHLRKVSNAMLRSGSYLPNYVVKVLRKPNGLDLVRRGAVPLEAFDKREANVFLKICGRREAIAKRICEIEEQLLADVEPFKLEDEGFNKKGGKEVKTE
jgi:hypothetical protein